MDNFIELINLDDINGGGVLGAGVGAVLGMSYGFAAGAVVAGNTGNIGDMFKTAWVSTMAGGGIGAVIPEP